MIITHAPPAHYMLAGTIDDLKAYIGDSKLIGIDFETAPDPPYRDDDKAALDPARAHVVGFSVSVESNSGMYVPIHHRSGTNIEEKEAWEFLRDLLNDSSITKVVHNLVFESSMAYAKGIVIQPPVYDTMCASQMTLKSTYEFRTLRDSGLKNLANEIFAVPLPTFTDVTSGCFFDELDSTDPETIRYACADADFALRLYHVFNGWFDQYLPAHRRIVEEIESPTAVYLGIMKYNGIPVDIPLMQQRMAEANAELSRLHDEIQAIVGNINIGANCSTQAFKGYLFQTLQLPVLKRTESNQESIDDMAMVLLKEYCDEQRPELSRLFTLVQDYRRWGKIKTTYIDGYLKYINPVTRRLHPEMFTLSTETGRMNCRNPNVQNMPRKGTDPIGVRNFIKAPEGHVILSLDYSQVELRVGTFYCRDSMMMETYQKNGDIHAATTSVIFGISYDEATDKHNENYKERRSIAKNVNFGTFYGLYPKGLQRTLKFKAGIDKSLGDCEDILSNLKRGYKRLVEWQETTKTVARHRMYTETWLGRRRYLPDIISNDWSKHSFAERCALNTPIQGTAADTIKLAIFRILKGLGARPWLKPILQIHDELVFIIPESRLSEAVEYVRGCMELAPFPEFDVPLIAEAAAGKSFGEMKELED